MKGINSKLIHGRLKDISNENCRSLKTPIYENASFDFESAESAENAFTGDSGSHIYSRISNPTVRELETRLRTFAGAKECLCVSSGMAAISNVILTICSSGDNIVTTKYLFGNTYSLFTKTLKSFGIEARFADMNNIDDIKKNIDDKTRCIFLEILTNPQLIIFDIQKISDLTSKKSIPLIIDNSVLTPYIFQSAKYKIDIEILSTTKFISGGATSVGGAIFMFESNKWDSVPKLKTEFEKSGNNAFWVKLSKEVYRNLGSCLSPNNAYLQLLGLETITIRIDKICQNALTVAKWLEKHDKVPTVNYSSLEKSSYYNLANKYFSLKSGCLIRMELNNKNDCFTFMNSLKMIRRGTNFCDNKTMVIHPSSTIFCDFTDIDKEKMDVNEGQLRLGIGLEDVEDIIDDIEQALGKV